MKKNISRIAALVLCLIFVSSMVFSASALTVSRTTKTTTCTVVTCGDKVFGKTTPITIKNTSSTPIKITLTQVSGCKVYRSTGAGFSSRSSITLYAGNSAKINIRTSLGNAGTVKMQVSSILGEAYSCTINGSNYSLLSRY